MQFKPNYLLSFALLAMTAFHQAFGTPVSDQVSATSNEGFVLSSDKYAEGTYLLHRDATGSQVIVPLNTDLDTSTHSSRTTGEERGLPLLAKREDIACFNATFDARAKTIAISYLTSYLTDNPFLVAKTGVGSIVGDAVVYVCNTTPINQTVNPLDVAPSNAAIDAKCEPTIAGTDKLDSGIEFGRTASVNHICRGV